MTNHLANSISPYLLQHAANPVDWYPWGEEALNKSKRQDKPIFLSIGYAACHWCHVMAHESFEDPEIAAIMNEHFISIKVDREERPDLDAIYMPAVVALTGQGGWPMSVFLTPNRIPFYGGTYFPPKSRYGLPSFKEILIYLSNYWDQKREDILSTSQQIANHLQKQIKEHEKVAPFSPDLLDKAVSSLINSYDWENGGWGKAPKFPQPMALEFLLNHQLSNEKYQIELVVHALRAMARGGMYDVIGGGFSRYSTDDDWRVPHFEKMLYDNALLARVYLHAFQITCDPFFRQVTDEILTFIAIEMLDTEGGFFSSLDADSEGEEGKYYLWTLEEIRRILGGKDDLIEAAYALSEKGIWEGKIILQRALDDNELKEKFNLSEDVINARIRDRHAELLNFRKTRVPPAIDDKILTSWNGLMLTAFAEAARVFQNEKYLRIAQQNAKFLMSALRKDGKLRRSWRKGQVSKEVFLEDYASLVLGLIDLYQSDFDNNWYLEAYDLTAEMVRRFNDPHSGFFDTPYGAEEVLIRPKELQDNAIPSGNALAAEALLKMAALSENDNWRQIADSMFGLVAKSSLKYPLAFSRWLSAASLNYSTIQQAAVIGDMDDSKTEDLIKEMQMSFHPHLIVAASKYPVSDDSPKLLKERTMLEEKPTAYVCENFVCKKPVTTIEQLRIQLSV